MVHTEHVDPLESYFNQQAYCTDTKCGNITCIANVNSIIATEFENAKKTLALQDLYNNCAFTHKEKSND